MENRHKITGVVLLNIDTKNANLRGADLCDANLRYADLCDANLRYANLCDADLRGANLCGADLSQFIVTGAILNKYQYACVGDILRVGCKVLPLAEWKKCYKKIGANENYSDLEIKLHYELLKTLMKQYKMWEEVNE